MNKLITAGLITVTVLVAAQFIRPERTNPESDPSASIERDQNVPPDVRALVRRSCFDCHSNETVWPWYSAITPANFLVAGDVTAGRKRLNFSDWQSYKAIRRQGLLERISDQVFFGQMPLPQYLYLHPEAKLSDEEVRILIDWADGEADRLIGEDLFDAEKGDQ